MREADGAIVDATLINSAARPREFIEAPLDRAEDEDDVQNDPEIRYSADPDARWIKKGSTSVLGYKGFIRVDDEGFVDRVHTPPANRGECPEFEIMIQGATAQRIMADKGYASKANRELLSKNNYKDGIMHKAARRRPLRESQKRFNQQISKRRFRVEQCFGTMKRLFGLERAVTSDAQRPTLS